MTITATPPARVSLARMQEGVRREIQMRRRVYPRQVASGKMKQSIADHEIETFEALSLLLTDLEKA